MSGWKPETAAPARPSTEELIEYGADRPESELDEAGLNARGRILYLRSYLLLRVAIGFIGVGLPFLLLGGDLFFLKGTPRARGSLSAYYYSGMRDVFVGILFATAIFLITYKVVEYTLDNALSMLAGIAAMAVALFPTSRPKGDGGLTPPPLTPLQEALGERAVGTVHGVSAVLFILSLAVISFFFGVREGRRTQRRNGRRAKMSPTFWRRFHWACASVVVLAVVFVAASKLLGWFEDYSVLVGEAVAVFAFGLSWLMKGLELDILRTPDVGERQPRSEAPVGAP
jgi:hypothetical protein